MQRFLTAALAVLLAAAVVTAAEDLRGLFPRPQEVAGWSISRDIAVHRGGEIPDRPEVEAALAADYRAAESADAAYIGPGEAVIEDLDHRIAVGG